MKTPLVPATSLCALLAACGDPGGGGSMQELITTVTLTFAPPAGPERVFVFDDEDGDGGAAPTVDAVTLAPGSYTLTVTFENRLETPAEDITAEVADEATEHQVFFTGSAVDGPAANNPGAPLMHAYADTDGNGLPIGLESSITAAAGTGELVVTLRHMPELNGQPVKTADSASDVSAGGITAIGGETDAAAAFSVTVQ